MRSRAWPVTPSSYHRTVSRTRRSHPPRRPRSHRHWLAGAHVIALAGAHQASYPPIPRFRRILPIGSCKSGTNASPVSVSTASLPAPTRRCSSRFALVRVVGLPLIRASPEWGRRAVPRLARLRKRHERSLGPRPSAVGGLRFLAHALRHAARQTDALRGARMRVRARARKAACHRSCASGSRSPPTTPGLSSCPNSPPLRGVGLPLIRASPEWGRRAIPTRELRPVDHERLIVEGTAGLIAPAVPRTLGGTASSQASAFACCAWTRTSSSARCRRRSRVREALSR